MDWRIPMVVLAFITAMTGIVGLMALGIEEDKIPSPGWELETTDTRNRIGDYSFGWVGNGHFADEEVFTQMAYILSHAHGKESQEITFGAEVTRPGIYGCRVDKGRYGVYLKACKDCDWVLMQIDGKPAVFDVGASGMSLLGTDKITFKARTINVIGPDAIGAIKVHFDIHCHGLNVDVWYNVLIDWAYLRSGIGSLDAPGQAAVGETIKVTWTIPYISAEGDDRTGWYLIGNHLDTGKDVVGGKKYLKSLQGTFEYEVLAEDWISGEGGVCKSNKIRFQLWNELWEKDWKTVTTIDVAGTGPVVSSLAWDRASYKTGDTATLTWNGSAGSLGYPIDYYDVTWGFTSVTEHEAEVNTTSYTTQGLGDTGQLQAEVIAYDMACRASPTARTYATVTDPNNPNTPPPPPPEANMIVVAIALTIAILVALLVGLLLYSVMPGDGIPKVLAVIIISLIIGIIVFFVMYAIGQALATIFTTRRSKVVKT